VVRAARGDDLDDMEDLELGKRRDHGGGKDHVTCRFVLWKEGYVRGPPSTDAIGRHVARNPHTARQKHEIVFLCRLIPPATVLRDLPDVVTGNADILQHAIVKLFQGGDPSPDLTRMLHFLPNQADLRGKPGNQIGEFDLVRLGA
jgi:hypothetical protein